MRPPPGASWRALLYPHFPLANDNAAVGKTDERITFCGELFGAFSVGQDGSIDYRFSYVG